MWFDESKSTSLEIEFFCGPLDGLCQGIELPRGDVPEVLVVPIKRDLLGGLVGSAAWMPGPVTSAAVYSRDNTAGGPIRYRFIGAKPIGEFDFIKPRNFLGWP